MSDTKWRAPWWARLEDVGQWASVLTARRDALLDKLGRIPMSAAEIQRTIDEIEVDATRQAKAAWSDDEIAAAKAVAKRCDECGLDAIECICKLEDADEDDYREMVDADEDDYVCHYPCRPPSDESTDGDRTSRFVQSSEDADTSVTIRDKNGKITWPPNRVGEEEDPDDG